MNKGTGGEDIMDVAALSTTMAAGKVSQSVGVAVLGKAMDQMEQQSSDLLKIMEQSVQPNLGGNVNIRA